MNEADALEKGIPEELRGLCQWVCWKAEERDGRTTKIPYSPQSGRRADSTDASTWASFPEAMQAFRAGGFSGVGFVFAEDDPFAGIDLDKVRNSDGMEEWARELIQGFSSYTELSQSGTGVHILIRGKIPGTRRRKGAVEIYDQGRFFVMTGQRLKGPTAIEDRQQELEEFCAELFPEQPAASPRPSTPLALSDRDLLEKARQAENGEKFATLWEGNWEALGYTSQSEADSALLGLLRFWTGDDRERSLQLFEQSGLHRPEKKAESYPGRTYDRLPAGDVYQPPQPAHIGKTMAEGPAEYSPFPVEALPPPFADLVREGAEAIGCDEALIAPPLLAAAAGTIGNARRVKLKSNWSEPAILWAIPVARSGEMKSPAFSLALQAVNEMEDEAWASYRREEEAYEAERQRWKDSGDKNQPPPERPVPERSIVRDVTVERLAAVLAENPRGVTLVRDELAAWFGSFDRYNSGKGEEAAHWLEMYNAGRVTADRKTGDQKTIHVPRAAVSISGTIQPGTLERLLEPKHFESGLVARLLLAWPPSRPRRWREEEVSEETLQPVRKVFRDLRNLPMGMDGNGMPTPVALALSEDARGLWKAFFNEHGAELDEMKNDHLRAAWSKLEGTAARLALVHHSVRAAHRDPTLPDPAVIDGESLQQALRLLGWFKEETRRIYGFLSQSGWEQERQRVLQAVGKREGECRVRDLQRAGLFGGDRQRIEAVLETLVRNGEGEWVDHPTAGGKGGRPTRSFRAHPTE